ncbi:hypothetical protein [Neisseria wadsworthii]|uniref:Uncharacterized protein n=1 Tax=Neisseria wadsworthii 9715 TaxID=1030841 RepID=G4CNI8_9NEIS|nr:hypothetical protein [Neisseria wadsworthii]EGZ49584.1 hypothetical protein HMPREF9370_0647 [Neisseria wadsworthii 9715]QMT36610.1 hypothetical protein H3L96_05255 [Neisseria wadsworthii]
MEISTEPCRTRSRAWRRWQNQKPSHKKAEPFRKRNTELRCLEKNWSMMYFRDEKMRRAKQLRLIYPFNRKTFDAEWFD